MDFERVEFIFNTAREKGNLEGDKELFVELLGEVLKMSSRRFDRIEKMVYRNEMYNEFVYVIFKNGSQKRICVNCDSIASIISDVIYNINNVEYLPDDKKLEA